VAKERLDATDSEEAARLLNVTLASRPAAFASAFRKAENTLGCDISGTNMSIALLWLNDYGAGVHPQKGKVVANALLSDSTVLRSLGKKTRFVLINRFFPLFTLPRGWRKTAEDGGITQDQIAALIMERLRMIDEGELDVHTQLDFIRMLLSRPRNTSESYRQIMTANQLDKVVEIVQRRALAVYRETRADTIGWRYGIR
jgi:hypothetical protein